MKIKKGDSVRIKGFIEQYCLGKVPPESSWQHDVYMAEKTGEVCTVEFIRQNGASSRVHVPSVGTDWWIERTYLHPITAVESEAEEL